MIYIIYLYEYKIIKIKFSNLFLFNTSTKSDMSYANNGLDIYRREVDNVVDFA